jgi:hypothetical protein
MKIFQVLANMVLYGFLAWLLYGSLIAEWDPWFAFVVGFVTMVAIVCQLMPVLHAQHTSPGEYPYHD